MIKNQGFTLIELIVVVSIIGVLAGVTIPLGSTWARSSKISTTEGELTQAIGRAKSAALRNRPLALAERPVVAMCISNSKVLTLLEGQPSVLQGQPSVTPNCAANIGTQIWTTQLEKTVALTDADNNAVSCMCFTNLSTLTTDSCAPCHAENSLTLSIGSKSESFYVY